MPYQVPAIERAIALLNYLRDAGATRSLAEFCQALDLPRTSGLYIAKTLEAHGFLQHDADSGKYGLGWALVGLGLRASEAHSSEEALLQPILVQLQRETGFTCLLGRVIGDQTMVVAQIAGSRIPRAATSLGHLDPLGAGAPGKAILAHRSDADVSDYLTRQGLPAHTEHTITNIEEFRRHLELARERGYATSFGEYNLGVSALASPVFNSQGEANLCVFVLALGSLLTEGGALQFGENVRRAAQRMTAALGGIWPK